MDFIKLFKEFPENAKPTREFFLNYVVYLELGKTTTRQNKKWKQIYEDAERILRTVYYDLNGFSPKIQLETKAGKRWSREKEEVLSSLYNFLISRGFNQFSSMSLIYDQLRLPFEKDKIEKLKKTVSVHIKNLKKDQKTGIVNYNEDHKEEKDTFTRNILRDWGPIRSILDLFSGEKSFYKDDQRNLGAVMTHFIYTNDINYGGIDASLLIQEALDASLSYDLVDVDCFGDPGLYGPIENLLKITRKILILTFGNCPRNEHNQTLQKNWGWEKLGISSHRENESYRDRVLNSLPIIGRMVNKKVSCIGSYTWKGDMGFRLAFLVEEKY